jgi:cell division protein FtsQ
MQQTVPRTGRALPGMPLEMDDPDPDDPPRKRWDNKGESDGHWYWPSSTIGRVLLGFGALMVLVIVGTAIDLSKHYLQHDSRFRIAGTNHIQVSGLTEVTRAELLPVFGEDIGRNVFFVPLSDRRKQLEQVPWVQQATVMRVLPDQLRVDIVERKPVAFTRHGQRIGLVDESGVLLDMAPAAMAAHHYSFPVLTGIDAGDKSASRQARMNVYARMMNELDSNGQHNSEQLSEIDLTDPEDARVLMPEQGTDILAHFGEDHFLERYQRYKDHIAEWRQQYPQLAAVDLRYDHQVVLDMASGASHAQPNPDEADAKNRADAKPTPSTPASTAKPSPEQKAAPGKSTKTKVAGKTSATSGKAKASTAKAKSKSSSKAAADKKHAQTKSGATQKTVSSKSSKNNAAQSKQKPSPITRPPAAEGQ